MEIVKLWIVICIELLITEQFLQENLSDLEILIL